MTDLTKLHEAIAAKVRAHVGLMLTPYAKLMLQAKVTLDPSLNDLRRECTVRVTTKDDGKFVYHTVAPAFYQDLMPEGWTPYVPEKKPPAKKKPAKMKPAKKKPAKMPKRL